MLGQDLCRWGMMVSVASWVEGLVSTPHDYEDSQVFGLLKLFYQGKDHNIKDKYLLTFFKFLVSLLAL